MIKYVLFFCIKKKYENQEAQKWWVAKSLEVFEKQLSDYNINLEIIKIDTYRSFFEKYLKKLLLYIGTKHMSLTI